MGKTGTCVLLLCFAAFFASRETGKSKINLAVEMKNGIPWPTMMLLAFALIMTSAITNEATGIQPFLKSLFEPVFGSAPNTVLFIMLACAVQLVLTNIFANMVIALLLVPLICTYAPIAALMHGNSEWVTAKEIYKYIGISLIFVLLVSTFICSTLGNLLF